MAFERRKRSHAKSPFVYGLGLLARRDYSRQQLAQKLEQRGYAADVSAEALDALTTEGWLDDFRYGSQLCRRLIERGYGPYYIRQAWQQKGVSPQCAPRPSSQAVQAVAEQLQQLPNSASTADLLQEPGAHENLECMLDSFDEDFWLARAEQLICSFAKSRWQGLPRESQKIWRRAFGLLQRRGYSGQVTRKVLGVMPVASTLDAI